MFHYIPPLTGIYPAVKSIPPNNEHMFIIVYTIASLSSHVNIPALAVITSHLRPDFIMANVSLPYGKISVDRLTVYDTSGKE